MKSGVLDEPESASRNFLNGEIAEILIYNKALTTQVLLKLALLYIFRTFFHFHRWFGWNSRGVC